VRRGAEAEAVAEDSIAPVEATGHGVKRAIEHVVLALPPKERACVLLKDVFDYSLEEIAELVDSSVGGVKAALNRGRSKLTKLTPRSPIAVVDDEGTTRLLALYVDRFDRRDWDGLRELISADARVRVADRFRGPLAASPYFGRYERLTTAWRMALGVVDGERVAIVLRREQDDWVPDSIARIELSGDRIVGVADYKHCPWIFAAAESVSVIPRLAFGSLGMP
jgi:RNA polymerase sigma-70 factor (ECF subfamily)